MFSDQVTATCVLELAVAPTLTGAAGSGSVVTFTVGDNTLKSGSIAFTPQLAGRDTIAVFVGEGEFVFDPVLPTEKAHLKILTDQEAVRELFDRALLCFSDDSGKEIRAQAKTPKADPKSAEVLRDYRKMLRHSPEIGRAHV